MPRTGGKESRQKLLEFLKQGKLVIAGGKDNPGKS